MSFVDCILSNTVLSADTKKKLVEEYNQLVADNIRRFGPIDGPQKAAQRYIEQKTEALTMRKNNLAKDALISEKNKAINDITAGKYKLKKENAGKAAKFLYFKSDMAAAAISRLEQLGAYIGSEFEMNMRAVVDIVEQYSSKLGGVSQDVEGFKNVVSEVLGIKTGDGAASSAAKQVKRLLDNLHTQYRAEGGIMGKIENYFPQRDHVKMVKNTSFDEYLSDKMKWVDRKRMVNQKTGMPLTDKEFADAVREIYDETVTHGLDDIALATKRAMETASGAIATRKSSSRFFHYKNADAYFANNAKYGGGDSALFDNFIDYVSSITRDTVVMRHLGPNSDLEMARWIADSRKDGASPQVQRTMQGMYDTVSGRNAYSGAPGALTVVTENVQNYLRAVMLGGAPVSAVGDQFFIAMAAKMNGIDAASGLGNYYKYLNPLDATDRKIAATNAFVSSSINANSLAQARFADTTGTGKMRFASSFVNRMSGLGIMTDAARTALPLETMSFMTRMKEIGAKFDDLPDAMKEAFARWGMEPSDFDNIIASEPHLADPNGASFIRPEDIANKETARKYGAWLYEMSQVASNEPGVLTRAITTGAVLGEAKRGTALRGISTSVMMFKSFGISVMLNHIIPAMQRGASEGKWGRLAGIMAGTTLLGAATIQAKNVMYGKTPEDMSDHKFWRKAVLQGGAFGTFGDVLLDDPTKYYYSWAEKLAGPAPQAAQDVWSLFAGNFERAIAENKESQFFKDLGKLAPKYTPKFWYTNLLQQRILYDQINRMADPAYDSKMRKIEKQMQKETGAEFWWSP